MDVRVISIGTLDANDAWGERAPVRSGHATTTLIRSGDATILVDPGLPGPVLTARLEERAGLKPDAVTHVFLTSFHPDTRRGIDAFAEAEWLLSEREREAVGVPLAGALQRIAEQPGSDDEQRLLEGEVAILHKCAPCPDRLARGVDLFPLPGVTPGMAGLLIPGARGDVLVCGDAVATSEHLSDGRLLQRCHDLDTARESLQEALEIADLLIPGRDNLVVNPTKRPF